MTSSLYQVPSCADAPCYKLSTSQLAVTSRVQLSEGQLHPCRLHAPKVRNFHSTSAAGSCNVIPHSYSQAMLDAVAGEAVGRLSDFNPQELSNVLVAYARSHNPPEHYLNMPLLEVRILI